MTEIIKLSRACRGQGGRIHAVEAMEDNPADALELERRLLEFGLVEGARVQMIHGGRWAVTRSCWTSRACGSRSGGMRCGA